MRVATIARPPVAASGPASRMSSESFVSPLESRSALPSFTEEKTSLSTFAAIRTSGTAKCTVNQGIFSPAIVRLKRIDNVQNSRNLVNQSTERNTTEAIAMMNAIWIRYSLTMPSAPSEMRLSVATRISAAAARRRCSSLPRNA